VLRTDNSGKPKKQTQAAPDDPLHLPFFSKGNKNGDQ